MIHSGLALAAVAGVFLRYQIDTRFGSDTGQSFPWHTFAINVMGSFAIGIIYVLTKEKNLISESSRIILMTGFLGAFTTFSIFSLQNIQLLEAGKITLALLYSAGSVIAGIVACYSAISLARLT
jgi:CrcB protein